jgi:UDP-N-acetylmuramate--alanine ligase
VISSIDADHLDIYQSRDHMIETYTHFAKKAASKGNLIIKSGIQLAQDFSFNTYGFAESCTVYANNIHIRNGRFEFDICNQVSESRVVMSMGGRHNVENALAAASVCLQCGINLHDISKLLSTYKGVWRRFDVQVSNEKVTYIDDYAHHPEELKACIQAARELYPGKKITGIFQPHLFSRTRDFMTDFANSLSLLDQLILLDIYPAREQPIDGITSNALLEKVGLKQKVLLAKHELIPTLKAQNPEVLLTMGAGDIDQLVEPIKEMLLTC